MVNDFKLSAGVSDVNMSSLLKNTFAGKVAVLTAATEGIGFGIAQRLAREGAKVVISSRKPEHVKSATEKLKAEGLEATGIVCHVAKAEERKRLFDAALKLGGIDILVSNAAANPAPRIPVLECEESAWDKIFEVNVKASYLLAKEALPYLLQRPYGRIIFISSISGLQPLAHLGAYGVSKTALIGLTKAAGLQLAKTTVTVNCVAPGVVHTRFSDVLVNTEERLNQVLTDIPMGRLGEPSDIAAAVAYLASPDANYITGETIPVAGGLLSRL